MNSLIYLCKEISSLCCLRDIFTGVVLLVLTSINIVIFFFFFFSFFRSLRGRPRCMASPAALHPVWTTLSFQTPSSSRRTAPRRTTSHTSPISFLTTSSISSTRFSHNPSPTLSSISISISTSTFTPRPRCSTRPWAAPSTLTMPSRWTCATEAS